VEFKPDGTFAASFSDVDVQAIGKWRLDGSVLLVTFTAPPEVAGINHSTVIGFGQADGLRINANTGGTRSVQTYVRE
jgi:hypothetical protein